MKFCKHCGDMLTVDPNFCYSCNATQTEGFNEFETTKSSDTFLKVLCTLTIIGASFSLIVLPFTMMLSEQSGIEVSVFTIILGFVIALAKLTGAIFMLKKKYLGLHIYTAAAVGSILSSIYSSIMMPETMGVNSNVTIMTTLLGALIVVAFIVMYWLPENRRHLS